MANPVCSLASLITNTPCLNQGCDLNPRQQMALKIWFAVNELARIGGTDYTANLTGTSEGALLFDANALFYRMDLAQRDTAELAIYYNNAVASGATISSNMNTLMASVAKLVQGANDMQLQGMFLLLLCQLGFHKTRPQ